MNGELSHSPLMTNETLRVSRNTAKNQYFSPSDVYKRAEEKELAMTFGTHDSFFDNLELFQKIIFDFSDSDHIFKIKSKDKKNCGGKTSVPEADDCLDILYAGLKYRLVHDFFIYILLKTVLKSRKIFANTRKHRRWALNLTNTSKINHYSFDLEMPSVYIV